MSKQAHTVEVSHSSDAHDNPNVLAPEVSMVILTWITFFLLLGVLYKFAWKPILSLLDKREGDLRASLKQADEIKEELSRIKSMEGEILDDAKTSAQKIVEDSRRAARDEANRISQKAKEESQNFLENARGEINKEVLRAQTVLRNESVQLAIDLAGKLIKENLDSEKNKKLVNRLIEEA